MKALRTQSVGLNLTKGRFENVDKKFVKISGRTYSDRNIVICGFELKKTIYKPTMKPLSTKRSENVTVRINK